jgi:D-xylose transport system substrate-binding protein
MWLGIFDWAGGGSSLSRFSVGRIRSQSFLKETVMSRRAITLWAVSLVVSIAAACGGSGGQAPERKKLERLKVGFLLDTTHERWTRDREMFTERAQTLGAAVVSEAGEGDKDKQAQLADKMIAEGVKVLVIVPNDAEAAASIVDKAKAKGVHVISYDRLVRNADVDMYVTFDNQKVGELQAQYLLEKAPTGNYLLIGGSETDNNAKEIRAGQMKVLEPAVKAGKIKIVGDGWAANWRADEAEKQTEAALKKTGNKLAAIVTSNDQTAGGAIQALEKAKLAGKVLVSGQDAELDASRRIVAGTQAMTVYKPLAALARMAANNAVRLGKGDPIDAGATVNNGKKDVPSRLLDPIPVDKMNLDGVLINDGYHTREQIYGKS